MAEYGNSGTNRESTFGRSLMSYVKDALPYGDTYNMLNDIHNLNPKYKDFYKTGSTRDDLINRQSIYAGQRD